MIDHPAAAIAAAAIAPIPLPHSVRRRIFLYLGILIILLAFGAPSGGLMDIPISFFLKNKLHLKAHEAAEFRLVSAVPLYLSCVFGFIRDAGVYVVSGGPVAPATDVKGAADEAAPSQ